MIDSHLIYEHRLSTSDYLIALQNTKIEEGNFLAK